LGDVIESKKMLALPLNGRSYIDLLGLQARVAPDTAGTAHMTGRSRADSGLTALALHPPACSRGPGGFAGTVERLMACVFSEFFKSALNEFPVV
jgi:hypothetical protein